MEVGGEHDPPRGGRSGGAPWTGLSSCAPLSGREDEALDEIEHDLAASDPGLFARMSRLDDPPPVPAWARVGAGLALGVMLLIFVIALPTVAGLFAVAFVAVVVVLPWVLSSGGGPLGPKART